MKRVEKMADGRRQQPLLALEVVIEHGLGDAGGLDDLAGRGGRVALMRKQPHRRVEQFGGNRVFGYRSHGQAE